MGTEVPPADDGASHDQNEGVPYDAHIIGTGQTAQRDFATSPRAGSSQKNSQGRRISIPKNPVVGQPGQSEKATPLQTPGVWSVGSGKLHGRGSQPEAGDRIFPMRSIVSVEPQSAKTSARPSSDSDYFGRMASDSTVSAGTAHRATPTEPQAIGRARSPPAERDAAQSSTKRRRAHLGGSRSLVQADAERYGSTVPLPIFHNEHSDDDVSSEGIDQAAFDGSAGGMSSASDTTPETAMTVKFKHITTEEGHLVITGRDGTLQRCEDEPIHAPGAVQGFGVMIAIREEHDGQYSVRQASENSQRVLGYNAKELFKLDSFLDILSDEQADNLLDHIDFIRDEDADPAVNGPEVFSMAIKPPRKRTVKLWCAVHIHPSQPDQVICEFELDNDPDFPLRPEHDNTPDHPEDTLQSNPTTEELYESTEINSKPLRVLRSARKQRGEAGAMQVFDIMSQIQSQLGAASNLDQFLKILVGVVKELTGFHRVMIYQFDATFNGKVVTELVDATQTKDLYKGLHFPASDIPKQARDLYRLNKVRLLYDRDQESARMVCRSVEDMETPLDMTHSYLRAMSPIHREYLKNMAVRSSMSISINAFGELWGLIACHSYGPKGMRVSFPIRKMCRMVGDTVSRNIERLSYASRLQARKLINTVPTDKNPSGYIIASSDDLLKLFDADFGMLSIRGETKIMGKIEQTQEALAMLEYLKVRKFTSVLGSQDIGADFPDLRYSPGFSIIAGLLYVPLSVGGNDFIVFFRVGQDREVKWAGNPYEKIIQEGTHDYLQPRKSFKVWHETVVGKCREWTEEQVETAAVLCLVYGKFIEVWRQKEAALQNTRLTRLLLANSAHEVRTPLNAIINYLEIAMEGTLDQETRENLTKSHSASKSLIYVINDLLDLTKTEEGMGLVKYEVFDFLACMREATEPFENDAKRKGIDYQVKEHDGLPKFVYGDPRRVRQAVANVTANAVQHTEMGSVTIEVYAAEVKQSNVIIEVVVEDTGKGMSSEQLDALFRDLEQVSTDGDEVTPEAVEGEDAPPSIQKLGLGLAVVARIVKNMDGRLRLKSEIGKGSRFVIQFPFLMPDHDSPGSVHSAGLVSDDVTSAQSVVSVSTTKPPTQEGEVTLVDAIKEGSSPTNSAGPALHTRMSADNLSLESRRSHTGSFNSLNSVKSDADRLIDAIQNPLSIGEAESSATSAQRRSAHNAYHATGRRQRSPSSTIRSSSPGATSSRPTAMFRSKSISANPKGRNSASKPGEAIGMEYITDSKTPIKPVRIRDDFPDQPERHPSVSSQSRVLFEMGIGRPNETEADNDEHRTIDTASTVSYIAPGPNDTKSAKLQVLVAEDDPINAKILRKRLEKAGHEVHHTVNGQECASAYQEKSRHFDVVLMDMQMPIVDGLTSTKMIRAQEHAAEHAGLSYMAANHGRIPIFAVSASLIEKERDSYISAGFDGWILKPVDFKRLNKLLYGIIDDTSRNECVYKSGSWELGGWFRRRLDITKEEQAADTAELRDMSLQGHDLLAAKEIMDRSTGFAN